MSANTTTGLSTSYRREKRACGVTSPVCPNASTIAAALGNRTLDPSTANSRKSCQRRMGSPFIAPSTNTPLSSAKASARSLARAYVSADFDTLTASGCSQTTSKNRSSSSWLAPLRRFSKYFISSGSGSLRSQVNAFSLTRWRSASSSDDEVLLIAL